jgi:hypothetical protein
MGEAAGEFGAMPVDSKNTESAGLASEAAARGSDYNLGCMDAACPALIV